MYQCHICRVQLTRQGSAGSLYWACPLCQGAMIGFGALRKRTNDRLINHLMQQPGSPSQRICPSCKKNMTAVGKIPNETVAIDTCKMCHMVWLDHGMLPDLVVPGGTNPTAKIEEPEHREPFLRWGLPEIDSYQLFPALMGLPVKGVDRTATPWPKATLISIGLMFIVFFTHRNNLEYAVNSLGFVPAEAFRSLGKTWVTSFLMHASWIHFLGNAYFFYTFGDEIENFLGPIKFVILFLLSHFMGVFLHSLHSGEMAHIPLVGASGGVFGIMAFYLVQFPRAKLHYISFFLTRMSFVTLTIPVWFVIGGKILFEAYLAKTTSMTGVAHWGHFGGAAVGIGWGFYEMKALEIREKRARLPK